MDDRTEGDGEDDIITLPVHFAAGQCFSIAYDHELYRNQEHRKNRVLAVLDIDSVGTKAIAGTWTVSAIESGGETVTAYDIGADDILIGIPVSFRADLDGAITEIVDKDAYLARVLGSDLFHDFDHGTKTKIFDVLSNMTDTGLAQHLLKVPAIMALCQGTSLAPGQPHTTTSESPSTFGNGAILTTNTFVSSRLNNKAGYFQIEFTSEADPERLAAIVMNVLHEHSPDTVFSEAELQKISAAQHSTRCVAIIDGASGFARAVTYEKIIEIPGTAPRLDRYDITIKRES